MKSRPSVLRLGDQVRFDEFLCTVAGLDGTRVRLADDAGGAQVVELTHLLTAPGFTVAAAAPAPGLDPFGLLDATPAPLLERARQWERHVVEVQTGLPVHAPARRSPPASGGSYTQRGRRAHPRRHRFQGPR